MVNISLDHIVGKLLRLQKQYRALAAMREEHLIFNLSCTALVGGESLHDLQRFPGIEPRLLTSRRRRLDPRSLRQKIKNHPASQRDPDRDVVREDTVT